jgi:hypothetical protein
MYEIATLAALRDRVRSGDIWIEGSRAYSPTDEHLMPRAAYNTWGQNKSGSKSCAKKICRRFPEVRVNDESRICASFAVNFA